MTSLVWENCACDWCGTVEGEELFTGPDLLADLPGQFRLVRCAQCKIIRQNPRLKWESLKLYYSVDYSPYESIIDRERSRFKRADRAYGMQKRLKAIERFKNGGRLLDVGCGTGVFLAEAKKNPHWEVSGVEPNLMAADYARNELEIPIFPERFSDAPLPESCYDVITMWNVLEHLDHPVQDLRRAVEILRPGGMLVICIPNLESIGAKIFGPAWAGWDLPRHLYLFPQHQLKTVLENIGLIEIDRQCIAGSHSAEGLNLRFWLKANHSYNTYSQALLRLYLSIPFRIIFLLQFMIIDRLRRGTFITIFAQKKTGQLKISNLMQQQSVLPAGPPECLGPNQP